MQGQERGALNDDPIYVKKKDIFVGNLSLFTSAAKLRDYFLPYGEISDVRIILHAHTGRSRRFGFITFAEEKTVSAIINSKEHFHLDGKDLDVKHAHKRSDEEGGRPPVIYPKKPFYPKELFDRLEPMQSSKIFIGGLMQDIEEKDIRECFSKFGKIDSLHLVVDKVTKVNKGFAFLTFSEEQSAKIACDVRHHNIKGKTVEARPAVPKSMAGRPSKPPPPAPAPSRGPTAPQHTSPPTNPIQYFSAWPQLSATYWNSYVYYMHQTAARYSPYAQATSSAPAIHQPVQGQTMPYTGLYPIQALYQAAQLANPLTMSPAVIQAQSVQYLNNNGAPPPSNIKREFR